MPCTPLKEGAAKPRPYLRELSPREATPDPFKGS